MRMDFVCDASAIGFATAVMGCTCVFSLAVTNCDVWRGGTRERDSESHTKVSAQPRQAEQNRTE